MSDIVEKLRDYNSEFDVESRDKAAEEITRLRAENETLHENWMSLEAEARQLRAQLAKPSTGTQQDRVGFDQWKEDYGLQAEPNYSTHTDADCQAAFYAGCDFARAKLAEAERQAIGEIAVAGNGQIWGFLNGPNEDWSVGDKIYIHPAPAKVPEGYALVPVAPTDEMLTSAMAEWDRRHKDGERNFMAMLSHCYQAMLKSQGGE